MSLLASNNCFYFFSRRHRWHLPSWWSMCLFQLKLLLKVSPEYLACCTCASSLPWMLYLSICKYNTMPHHCCVSGCKIFGVTISRKILPVLVIEKRWIVAIRRSRVDPRTNDLWKPGKHDDVVCGSHFTTKDYLETLLGKKKHIAPIISKQRNALCLFLLLTYILCFYFVQRRSTSAKERTLN